MGTEAPSNVDGTETATPQPVQQQAQQPVQQQTQQAQEQQRPSQAGQTGQQLLDAINALPERLGALLKEQNPQRQQAPAKEETKVETKTEDKSKPDDKQQPGKRTLAQWWFG